MSLILRRFRRAVVRLLVFITQYVFAEIIIFSSPSSIDVASDFIDRGKNFQHAILEDLC